MNILITVNTYYPFQNGVQAVTQYLAEGLSKKGHLVTVVTAKLEGMNSVDIVNNVRIIRVPIYTKHTFYCGEKDKYINIISKLVMENDFMINICTQNPFTDLLLGKLKKMNIKKILFMHGMCDFRWSAVDFKSLKSICHKIWNNSRWFIYYRYNSKNFLQYDKVIQIHKKDYAYNFMLKNYGIKSEVIENAVSDIFFDRKPSENNRFLKSNYFIYIANYFEQKNQKLVMKAFYKSKIDKKYKMIFIGSEKTEYYYSLLKLKKKLDCKFGYRDVDFLTNIERNDLPKYLYYADLFLMGSDVEKFPVSIIESLACGTPFISTDVGIVKYLKYGYVVNSAEEMSKRIEELVNNKKFLEKLSMKGEAFARQQFKIKDKVDSLDKMLKSL